MEVFTFNAVPVDSLAEEFEIPDLRVRLADAGITLVPHDGREFVVEHDWRRYVRDLSNAAQAGKASAAAGGWSAYNRDFLARYPQVNDILEGFVGYLAEHAPEVKLSQNQNSITFSLPNRSRAGLYLKRTGILLYATRLGKPLEHLLTEAAADHYERSLQWLCALPGYGA